MTKSNKNFFKVFGASILFAVLILAGSCNNWMSNDDFMEKIENEVHDANATQISVYVRYANQKMGNTEPQGNSTFKVDVASKISAVTAEDYGFVKWAAFSTKDFPADKQHTNLTFISQAAYDENFKEKELPETVVKFTNPKDAVTDVKIFEERNDIFLIPIVANRPAYVQSVPANADSNIVKNTSIRILFSKAIDKNTLVDEDGKLNFSITTSAATLVDDNAEIETTDITDYFDYNLSESGMMLTLKLKERLDSQGNRTQYLLENRQRITITLYEGLCDLDGFSMNGNFTFNFTTGTNTDSLAPMIDVIYGGTGDKANVFVSFHNGETNGEATDASKNAPKDINSTEYTDTILAQRVYDKLNLFVAATDIVSATNGQINVGKDLSEDNVNAIGIQASLYVDQNGDPVTLTNAPQIERKNHVYIAGTIDPDCELTKLFDDYLPVITTTNADGTTTSKKYDANQGTFYTYDISSLPDGLIKIDVWGVDMTGNSGGPGDRGAPYYSIQDNSYKSIFVVKDTTPIDSAEVKVSKKVISNSADAPYYWYNSTTLNTMRLFDTSANKITDYGHVKLRSPDNNLWWTFGVGENSSAPAADSKSWVRIHDATTGASLPFALDNAVAPSQDGPVDITLFLKDDIGNVSIPVVLDSIMYDNTTPVATLLDNYGDFVKEDGTKDLHASQEAVIHQILKVSFTEPNENNSGSGVRRIEIHVKKGDTEVPVPLDPNTFAVKYAPASNQEPTPANAERTIDIVAVADDNATTNNIKVFNVTDSTKITTGTLFIYGLTLGDDDGQYTVSVNLYDSALNKSAVTSTKISRDTTDPIINKVKVLDVRARTVYGDASATKTWWLPKDKFDSNNNLTKAAFEITAAEYGSGIEKIILSQDVEFTQDTKLKVGTTYLTRDVDYALDTTAKEIRLLDNYNVIILGQSQGTTSTPVVFTLENIKLNNINSSAANKVGLKVIDFVNNDGTNKIGDSENYQITYDGTPANYDNLVHADNTPPVISDLKIEDSAQKSETNPDTKEYHKDKYTDSQNVVLTLTLKAENESQGSGVEKVTLTDNAEFTDSTQIYVNDALLPQTDYQIDLEDKKSVNFNNVFVAADVLKFTNVNIISSTDGPQTVTADLTDFVGLDTVNHKVTAPLTLDKVNPQIDAVTWVPDNNLVPIGKVRTEEITDQTLKVDFTEATAGVKVIRFDVDYEGAGSYETPFDMPAFQLKYGDNLLTANTDYTISDGRYILLTNPVTSGTFDFANLKLRDSKQEGQYNIKITLLDAAENKNPQNETQGAVYAKSVFMDTTAPVVNMVQVMGAQPRVVYGDTTETATWWLPHAKFTGDVLDQVSFQIKVDEAGSGLKYIDLSQDVEFTENTILKVKNGTTEVTLIKGTDYTVDTAANRITLLNHDQPKLKGVSNAPTVEFTLENIKLNNINTNAGNKVAFKVFDFVENDGTNNISNNDYKLYYNDTTDGTLVYADSTPPQIANVKIEDAAQNSTNNPDNKAYDAAHYTNSSEVTLTLKLAPESAADGSGVKVITLTNNARFTNTTEIFVDGTQLTKNTDYTIADSYGFVTFTKVFTGQEELKFTNVHIVSSTEGAQTVKADLTDFVGISTGVTNETLPLILDTVKPSVAKVNWEATQLGTANGVTVGAEKDMKIDTQSLVIDFDEATAGIKIIKFEIHTQDGTGTYANPFGDSDFKLSYKPKNGTTETVLTKGTSSDNGDYQIVSNGTDQNINQYIVLKNTYTSGSFIFDNITLTSTNIEATYKLDVTMLDAAENKVDCYETIAIDSVRPVINGNIYIPDLLHAKELTTSSGSPMLGDTTGTHWLTTAQQGNSSGGKAPNKIPVYINIDETNSGVKVIKFRNDVILDSEKTKLYTATSTADSYGVAVDTDKYIVDTTNNTITINETVDCFKAGSTFTLLVKGVGFKNADTTSYNSASSNGASKNSISLQVSDVAMNASDWATTAESYIYSDSFAPASPSSLKLLDRGTSSQGFDAGQTTRQASEDYTNESKVNMKFRLSDCEKTGSGYYKFVISGAKFTSDTKVIVTTASGGYSILSESDTSKFTLENDTTLVLKDSAGQKYVLRQAVDVTFTNIEFTNSTENGLKTVYLTASDLAGWSATTVSDNIYFDNAKPQLEKLFTANYTSGPDWYKPAINVYPHPNGEDAAGVSVNYTNGNVTKAVPTFYTATTYRTGYGIFGGELSNYDDRMSRPSNYGAVLGFRASDNIKLGGYNTSSTYLYYKSDSTFSSTASDIISSGTRVSTSSTDYKSVTTNTNSQTSQALCYGFIKGNYSAVIVDEAGNVSDVFHFAVVADYERPSTSDFSNRQIIESPDASYSIYRNAAASTTSFASGNGTSSFNYANWNNDNLTREPIRTVKFVTKKADKKFKLYLKLGGTSSTDFKYLNGAAASTTSAYGELTGTDTSSPIEKYAISTWYGAWPTADNPETEDINEANIAYEPAVPKFTTFPGGGTLEATANYNSDDSAKKLVGPYFNYSSTTATWRVEGGYNQWWDYTPKTSTPTSDSQKNYDSGNGIYSYVDSNNNLVIEVPNTRSTPPITVFLRDGCGNMSYVVLGLNGYAAASFDFDDKLGKVSTSNGEISTPQIVQNPHLTYSSTKPSDSTTWNGYYYSWNSQSGNGNKDTLADKDGVAETIGFIKDKIKYATYYNTNIYVDTDNKIKTNTYSYKKPKLALTLQYADSRESVLFGSGTKYAITNPDPNAAANTANDYTCRALLYCTTSSSVPKYTDIVNDTVQVAGSITHSATAYRTNWVGVKALSNEDQATIIFDYPEPPYSTLGWTVNNATTHEPQPYYIWYIFEDRVGNYEIGKVVNSNVTGSNLKTSTRYGYDMWLYDGEAPVVTTLTGADPRNISSSQVGVDALISDNNGYIPYYAGGTYNTVWISSNPNRGIRDNSLIKGPAKESWSQSNPTWGVTNKVENEATGYLVQEREYLPFANLTVSKEITGIKAFCWSTSSTAPAYNKCVSTDNTQGDKYNATDYPEGAWFAGSGTDANMSSTGKSATIFDVGWGFNYKNSTNAYLPVTSGNTYAGKYTGTKINVVLPYDLIDKNPGCALYLHVMDWTGNVASYRMGSSLTFKNDITGPAWNKNQAAYSEDEHYEVTDQLKVTIAGNEAGSADRHETMYVRMPTNYFTETGSGFAGFKFGNSSVLSVKDVTKDSTGTYIEIPYDVYKDWPVDGKKQDGTDYLVDFYCFDNVGNTYNASASKPNGQTCCFTAVNDKVSPAYDTVSFVTKEGEGTEFIHTSTDEIKTVSGYGKVTNFTAKTGTTKITTAAELEAAVTAGKVQEIWVNKLNTSRFHINLTSSITEDVDVTGLGDAIIKKWTGSAWSTVSSWKVNESSWTHSGVTYYPDSFTLLNSGEEQTYYQIDVRDKAGNHSYQYFKIYLDDQGPTVVARTDATTTASTAKIELGKGSINSVGSGNNKVYYYTADSSHPATIKFAMTDDNATGKGIKNSKQKFWYSFDPAALDETAGTTPSKWKEFSDTTDGTTDITATVASGDLDKIYLKDVLGNTSEVDVSFNYTYTNAAGASGTEPISKLNFYGDDQTEGAPAAPVYTVNNYNHNNDTIKTRDYGNGNFAPTEIKKLSSTGNTILINSRGRKELQISFTPSNNIIGYFVTDANGNVIPQTAYKSTVSNGQTSYRQEKKTDSVIGSAAKSDDVGGYSFTNALTTSFVETLPLIKADGTINSEQSEVSRNYYAVDVVGNVSEPLTITYSYDDPNTAQNIELVESINDVTGNSTTAGKTVKELMEDDGIVFTNYAKKEGEKISGNNDNKKGKVYFNPDGFIVIRCTLPAEIVNNDYEERPVKVELYDVWDNGVNYLPRGYSAVSTDSNYNDVFKVYPSTQKDGERNYCYIAFKLVNRNGQIFDNNTQYGGSVIYAMVYGAKQAKSNFGYLKAQGVTKDKNYGWQTDTTGPTINNNNFFIQSNEPDYDANAKKIKGYIIAEDPYAETNILTTFAIAKDSNVGNGYESNIYKEGTAIFLQVREKVNNKYNYFFGDDLTNPKKYKFVPCDGFAATTPSYDSSDTSWTDFGSRAFNNTGYYKFVLPDITTPHKHLALFLADEVGNVSEPYYLVNKNATAVAWWLTDNDPQNVSITKDGTEAAPEFVDGTTQYVLNVAMQPGAVIKNIAVDNATISSVQFNDYSKGQPQFNAQTGTFNNNSSWINISGMKVTINVNQTWFAQDVNLYINDTDKAHPYDVFEIAAKKLGSSDITLTPVAAAEWESSETYNIPITLNNNAPVSLLSSLPATSFTSNKSGVTVTLVSSGEGSPYFKLEGLPTTKKWGAQEIKISMSGDSIDGTITQTALTIPAITAGDIKLKLGEIELTGENGFTAGTENYTITINAPDTIDSVTFGGTELTLSNDNKVTITGIKKQWDARDVELVINGDDGSENGVTLTKKVFRVGAIDADDITLKLGDTVLSDSNGFSADTSTYVLTIVAPDEITSETTITCTGLTSNDWSRDENDAYKLTLSNVKKQWAARDVSITIGSVTKKVFNVPAIVAADIKLVQGSGDSQTSGDTIAWSTGTAGTGDNAGKTVFTFKIAAPSAVPAGTEENPTEVRATYGTASFTASAQSVTLVVPQDWSEHAVDLTINGVTKTGILTVPVKLIEASDITLTKATSITTDGSYSIPIEMDAAGLAILNAAYTAETPKVTLAVTGCDNATVILNTDVEEGQSPKFEITGGPTSQTWSTQTIKVTISNAEGNSIVKDTVELEAVVISAKKIGSDDITLTPAVWASGNNDKTEYTILVSLNGTNPPPIETLVQGLTIKQGNNSLTTSWVTDDDGKYVLNNEKYQLKLKGFKNITQNYTEQTINVSITGTNINGTITAGALTVPIKTIAANQITIGTATIPEGQSSYVVTISLSNNIPATAITSVTADNGVTTTLNGYKVTLGNIPEATWSATTIKLTVNGIKSKDVLTIAAKKINSDYVEFTPVTCSSGVAANTNYTVLVKLKGTNAPSIETFAENLKVWQGNTQLTASWVKDGNNYAQDDDGNYKLNLKGFTAASQTFDVQNIEATFKGDNIISDGVSAEVLTVPAKKFNSSCITISKYDEGPDKVTDWGKSTDGVGCQIASDVEITSISSKYSDKFTATIDGNIWPESGKSKANVKLKLKEGATVTNNDIVITVTTAKGSADQGVYVTITPVENRFFGRSISIDGIEDTFTFGYTPGTVAAMQTRIVELPDVVQKALETFSAEAEDVVTTVVAPVSQIVQPKKSSKKAAKKSAKTTAPAAVEQVSKALETTALPSEALVAPAVEDQLAMILPQTAAPQEPAVKVEAALPAAEPQAVLPATEVAPAKHSAVAIWIVLVAVLASVAGLIFLKKKKLTA